MIKRMEDDQKTDSIPLKVLTDSDEVAIPAI